MSKLWRKEKWQTVLRKWRLCRMIFKWVEHAVLELLLGTLEHFYEAQASWSITVHDPLPGYAVSSHSHLPIPNRSLGTETLFKAKMLYHLLYHCFAKQLFLWRFVSLLCKFPYEVRCCQRFSSTRIAVPLGTVSIERTFGTCFFLTVKHG